MKPYFDHMETKTTHERRQHAMQVAGILTAVVFVGWVASLGLSFTGSVTPGGDSSQTAAVSQAPLSGTAPYQSTGNQLVVSTSTQ
jgi:hypothetical protein